MSRLLPLKIIRKCTKQEMNATSLLPPSDCPLTFHGVSSIDLPPFGSGYFCNLEVVFIRQDVFTAISGAHVSKK